MMPQCCRQIKVWFARTESVVKCFLAGAVLRQDDVMNAIRPKHRLRPVGGRSSKAGFRLSGVVRQRTKASPFGKSRFPPPKLRLTGTRRNAALNRVPVYAVRRS